MEDKNSKEALEVREWQNVMQGIYQMLQNHIEDIEICFECYGDGESIALFSQQGACKLKKFIDGGYLVFFPFAVSYRSAPGNDRQRMNQIAYLSSLSEWMEEHKTGIAGVKVERLTATSVPFKNYADGAGENDYVVTFEMTYRRDEYND